MDANKIKINRKRRLGNTSISDFFKPKVCNTDGNNNASSSVIGNPLFIFEIPPFLDQGGIPPPPSWQHVCDNCYSVLNIEQ